MKVKVTLKHIRKNRKRGGDGLRNFLEYYADALGSSIVEVDDETGGMTMIQEDKFIEEAEEKPLMPHLIQ